MNCQTEAIRCYSCSDCANTTRTSWETIQTVNKDDACIVKTTDFIFRKETFLFV